MSYEVEDEEGEKRKYPTMRAALEENRILKIRKGEVGFQSYFELCEGCDEYFSLDITPEQLAALGKELIDLATDQG